MLLAQLSKGQRGFRAGGLAAAVAAAAVPALARGSLTLSLSTSATDPTQVHGYLTPDMVNTSVPIYVYATMTGTVATDFQGIQYVYFNVTNGGIGGATHVNGSFTSTALPVVFDENGSLGGQLANVSGGLSIGSTTSLDYPGETPGSNGASPAKPRSKIPTFGPAGTSAQLLMETLNFTPSGPAQSPGTFAVSTLTAPVQSTFLLNTSGLLSILTSNGLKDALWWQDCPNNSAVGPYPGAQTGLANTSTIPVTLTNAAAGDANGDGLTNFSDFSALSANYGQSGATWAQGDFNGDGVVGPSDFSAQMSNLDQNETPTQIAAIQSFAASLGDQLIPNSNGTGFTTAPIPEPASACLIGLGAIGLLSIRRRVGRL
jgi:hypothetical protein